MVQLNDAVAKNYLSINSWSVDADYQDSGIAYYRFHDFPDCHYFPVIGRYSASPK